MPGVWHNKMESLFDSNKREVKFCYQTRYEICTRIADVILSDDSSLEIQHSYITDEEIQMEENERTLKPDYDSDDEEENKYI